MPVQREIDLRHVLETVLAQWRLVAAATLLAMLAAGIVAWGLLKSQYTSEMLLQFSKSRMGTRTTQEDLTGLAPDTFIYYILNNTSLQRAFDELGLGAAPHNLTFERFRSCLSASHIRNTNLIRLSVTLPDPELAQRVAGFLGREGVERNQRMMEEEIERSQAYLKNSVADASDQFLRAYHAHLNQKLANELERRENEVRQNSEVIKQIQLDYTEAFHSYQENLARKHALESYMTGEGALEKIDTVTQTIAQSSVLKDIVKERTGARESQVLPISMQSELINYVYNDTLTKLIQADSDLAGMKAKMEAKREELARMEEAQRVAMEKLARARADEERFYGEFTIARDTLGSLQPRLLEAAARVIEERQDLGPVDSPRLPERPSGPPRLLYVLVAGVLGFGVSCTLLVLRQIYLSA
ncbi:hypothetical protein HS125_01645 [bacterium]|nr:hypothetical protein [bacterium]